MNKCLAERVSSPVSSLYIAPYILANAHLRRPASVAMWIDRLSEAEAGGTDAEDEMLHAGS